jgi:hypothetical protein
MCQAKSVIFPGILRTVSAQLGLSKTFVRTDLQGIGSEDFQIRSNLKFVIWQLKTADIVCFNI